jgi:pimeloyl-ACP methyl ester carboxylesterase
MKAAGRISLLLSLTLLAGCASVNGPMSIENPDFAVNRNLALLECSRMQADRIDPPSRPIVILGGYRQPSFGLTLFAQRLTLLTGAREDQILKMAYPFSTDIDAIACRVVKEIDRRWPSGDSSSTVEVDVIGVSMGGIVARRAALGNAEGKKLKIARLFTLATPHRGARRAEFIAPDGAARALRAGSPLLARLDEAHSSAEYELICYAQLNDRVVGATRTAPPGMQPYWVPGTTIFSHMAILHNRVLLVDIARRLRGEPPLAKQASIPPCD